MIAAVSIRERISWQWLAGVACLLASAASACAQQPAPTVVAQPPQCLSLDAAITYALENNPALAAKRQQHGIAAARVVIANTYPFNPTIENRVQVANGPPAAGITNSVPLEHIMLWEVELRRQSSHRRAMAAAALSRTDWEIAYEEQSLAIQVIKAYVTVIYRQEKLKLLERMRSLNERTVADVERLMKSGKFRLPDKIAAQTEVSDILDQEAAAKEALTAAWQDLYRALGPIGCVDVTGGLETPPPAWCAMELVDVAMTRRADVQARRLAVSEAEANVRLTTANRFGNPVIGPAFTYDPTGIALIGVQINVPIPVANLHRGEINEAKAQQVQAALQLRQAEVNALQDVAAALSHLEKATQRADLLRTKTLPDMKQAADDMDRLFQSTEPGLTLLQVIDVRRKLLKQLDSYLDALLSVRLARAEILAATGEPALDLCQPAPPVIIVVPQGDPLPVPRRQ
jgi:outer membrane protein TolC